MLSFLHLICLHLDAMAFRNFHLIIFQSTYLLDYLYKKVKCWLIKRWKHVVTLLKKTFAGGYDRGSSIIFEIDKITSFNEILEWMGNFNQVTLNIWNNSYLQIILLSLDYLLECQMIDIFFQNLDSSSLYFFLSVFSFICKKMTFHGG